jgi:outer membrane lipoprotein
MVIHHKIPLRWVGFLLISLVLSGCATVPAVYDPIQDADFKGPLLKVVRANPETYINTRVRWGGSIARVENRRDETWLEIVEYPLDEKGYPYATHESAGRFMARFRGFLDPAIYAVGRQITTVGTLTATTQGKVGEYPYTYPVVTVEQYRLWQEPREPDVIYYYPGPFWYYHPWYDPFYPWGYRRYYYR